MTEYMNQHTQTLSMEMLGTHLDKNPYLVIDDGYLTMPLRRIKQPRAHIFLWKKRLFKVLNQIQFPKDNGMWHCIFNLDIGG